MVEQSDRPVKPTLEELQIGGSTFFYQTPEGFATAHDSSRYLTPSFKGTCSNDLDNETDRQAVLTE